MLASASTLHLVCRAEVYGMLLERSPGVLSAPLARAAHEQGAVRGGKGFFFVAVEDFGWNMRQV